MMLECFRNLIAFIMTVGILITIHEYGHFLAARCLKVKVERFSIGFGPVLWNWKDKNGTEYTISVILLGGYVKLLDIDNKDNMYLEEKYTNIWSRGCIIISGPVFNFILSILLYTIVYSVGIPIYKPIIAYIFPNSIAYQANMSVGSQIKSVNGISVYNWKEVRLQILNCINQEKIIISSIPVSKDNSNVDLNLCNACLPINKLGKSIINTSDPLILLGFLPNVIDIKIIELQQENYIFDNQTHLQVNDKILLINYQPIYNLEFFKHTILNHLNQKLTLTIDRDQKILNIDLMLFEINQNDLKEVNRKINLFLDTIVIKTSYDLKIQKYTLCVAIERAVNKTYHLICSVFNVLMQLILGNISVVNVHGPIAIAREAGKSVHFGIVYYLMFLAEVSINLGIINLFPMPILDGGQLFFLLIREIVNRKILNRLQHWGYIISFIILVCIMIIALYNDITI